MKFNKSKVKEWIVRVANRITTNGSDRRRTVYLPVEIPQRDFLAKYFLARVLAEYGFRAVIGNRFLLESHAGQLPAGIYYDRALARPHDDHLETLKNNGHVLVCSDVEAHRCFTGQMFYVHFRKSRKAVQLIDKYFSVYEHENEVNRCEYSDYAEKFAHVGSPRFDILTFGLEKVFQEEIEHINKRIGEDFTIAVISSWKNHVQGETFWKEVLEKFRGALPAEKQIVIDHLLRSKEKSWKLDREMVEHFRKGEEDEPVVVRPHPTGADTYDSDAFRCLEEYSIYPWIYAASNFVQSGCTSAIEALVAGSDVSHFGSRYIGDSFSSRYIPGYTGGGPSRADATEALQHECKVEGEKFASTRIAEKLDGMGAAQASYGSVERALEWIGGDEECTFKYMDMKNVMDSSTSFVKTEEAQLNSFLVVQSQ